MSGTIYGGETLNKVIIDDMVDDNHDYIFKYPRDNTFFARLSLAKNTYPYEILTPALVLFNEETPFYPLWAIELKGGYSDYANDSGYPCGDLFDKALNYFWESINHLSLDGLKAFVEKEKEKNTDDYER